MSYFKQKIKYEALTGGEAVAEAMGQIEPGVVPIYPITPQTPIVEKFAALAASGKVDSEVITAESEHSVMSIAIGAAASGVRSMTATSSVGLAYMFEMLNVASGMRMPIVLNVASRALSAPINIHCDHSDVMGVRDSGFIQLWGETAQEAYDNTILAVRLAEREDVRLPVMVVQDGFETSHTLEKVEKIEDEKVKNFIGTYSYPHSLLKKEAKKTFGPLVLPNHYLEIKNDQWTAFKNAEVAYAEIGRELEKISGREYPAIELFQVDENTEAVIIALGASVGTAKNTAKKLKADGYNVGVVKIKLFRPFPFEKLAKLLAGIDKIAVLDRTFSLGSRPPLFTEVREAFWSDKKNKKIQSYVFGLGGRSLKESQVEGVFADLLSNDFHQETRVIGLEE